DGRDEAEYLRELAFDGLRSRYGDPPPAEAVERLEMELGVISRVGFAAYFLIVWDVVKFAKDNGIAVGPGRGSAAGSIVAYSLNITDVDPLRHGLLFDDWLKQGEELARAYKEDPQARQIIDVARGLEGIVRNSSIHAAAVVIADRPLTDIVPLQLAEDRGEVAEDGTRAYRTVTQYSMKPIEDIGLLK